SISQAAALEALSGDQAFLKEWTQIFGSRRFQVCEKLNSIPGLSCRLPKGAFYLYISCEGLLNKTTPSGGILQTDKDVATYFLDFADVAVVHGQAFGLSPYFRISYATSLELLLEACARIEKAIAALR
ncbi:MAG TPA: aminotransferase class I/II-fold pyridoxal phosphate-dependent enzyme, partial [Alphaproteobacteria bacterium]|nr:aminotransferase class I/II-fold pyridoxal phosphate-dependent enzyme [Alphaproteobacteria bacterium]